MDWHTITKICSFFPFELGDFTFCTAGCDTSWCLSSIESGKYYASYDHASGDLATYMYGQGEESQACCEKCGENEPTTTHISWLDDGTDCSCWKLSDSISKSYSGSNVGVCNKSSKKRKKRSIFKRNY